MENSFYRKISTGILLTEILYIALTLVSHLLSERYTELIQPGIAQDIAVIISECITLGLPVYIYLCIMEGHKKKILPMEQSDGNRQSIVTNTPMKRRLSTISSLFLLSAATIVISYVFRNLIYNILYGLFEITSDSIYPHEAAPMSWAVFLIRFISIAVIPAICEELFFRKILVDQGSMVASGFLAILVSTLCFTLAHGSIYQAILVIPLGVVTAILMYRTRRLLYCVLLHASFNAFALFDFSLEYVLFHPLNAITYKERWVAVRNIPFCFSVIIFLGIVIYYAMRHIPQLIGSTKQYRKDKRNVLVYIAGSIALCMMLLVMHLGIFE